MILLDDILYWALLIAPVFLWGAYHYYKDRHQPEPVIILILAMVLGYFSAYIGLYLYGLLGHLGLRYDAFALAQESSLKLFLYSVLAIGPIEELAKFLPFILIMTRMPHFDEHVDGIVYASFIGLGFSVHENQQYLLFLSGHEAVARAIVSPIVHALFASIWGYAFCFADQFKISRFSGALLGLLVASVLHGVYDFFAIGGSMSATIGPPIIILSIWIWQMWTFHQHSKHLD
jgi:RsiW-degrading membrane proteinase PrsW (M82 family)